MNDVHDLTEIKKAKIVVTELEKVIQIINLSQAGLLPFRKYTSLQETLLCLEDSKLILEIHLENSKRVLETKGKRRE